MKLFNEDGTGTDLFNDIKLASDMYIQALHGICKKYNADFGETLKSVMSVSNLVNEEAQENTKNIIVKIQKEMDEEVLQSI